MIDWQRIQELSDEIGADDLPEVVDLFLTEVESAIAQMDDTADPDVIGSHMHFLKGAALNLGFQALSVLCHQGEKAAMEGQSGVVSKQQVRQTFDASRLLFERELPMHLAA